MKKIILFAAVVILSVAFAVPAEACIFGAKGRARRQDRRATAGSILRAVLPPYGR